MLIISNYLCITDIGRHLSPKKQTFVFNVVTVNFTVKVLIVAKEKEARKLGETDSKSELTVQ